MICALNFAAFYVLHNLNNPNRCIRAPHIFSLFTRNSNFFKGASIDKIGIPDE